MRVVDRMLKIVGKDNFQLDEKIGIRYILRLCWKYGWMMVRGKIFAIGKESVEKNIFVGRHVKVLEKRYLRMGRKTKIHDYVYIDALSEEGVTLGDFVVLGRGTRIECTGGLQHIGKGVKIGDRTTFGNDCFFGAAGGIEVGSDVVAGQFIRFHSENHKYDARDILLREQGVTHSGIIIGNNCWIGSGVVFLDGAEVGDGCVIAANAVVTKKIPSDVVIGGIPAKVLKNRFD